MLRHNYAAAGSSRRGRGYHTSLRFFQIDADHALPRARSARYYAGASRGVISMLLDVKIT